MEDKQIEKLAVSVTEQIVIDYANYSGREDSNRALFRKETYDRVLSVLLQAKELGRKEVLDNVWMLRQWLNEDRNCTPLVTNEDILHFIRPHN